MIKEITYIDTLKEIVEFSWNLYLNPSSSSYPREDKCLDDMYKRYKNIMLHKDDRVLACYADNKLVGTLNLFVESKDKYAQSNGFFIDGDYKTIADEFMKYIDDNYSGYDFYIGLPPENTKANKYFTDNNFECIDASIKTSLLKNDFICDTLSDNVENLKDNEFDIYAQFHDKYAKDIYWTSERIKQNRNIWDIYVLKDNNQIVGSIFIKLYDDDSAEIFGLFLDDKYKNYELDLLSKSVNEVLNKGKNEILYFIEEDLKLQLETAKKIGFRPIENYRCYMKKIEDYKIGSIISFGDYNWRVLDTQEDAVLIITEEIIEQRSYHDAYKDITWADCSLRKYLNGEFYDKFSAADKSRIIPVINKNPDNQWYGSKGGEDTQDSIFLLSLEEVCKYFGDSSSKLYNRGKNQRYWFERKDENNSKRIARLHGKEWGWWWWLRSPGRVNVKAVYIFGTDGNIGIQGNNILKGNISDGKCTGGVRPALWLKL